MDRRLFIGLFILVQALWAGSYVVGHFIVQAFDPLVTVQLRYTIAMLTMMPILLLFFRKQRPDFRDRRWWFHVLLVAVTSGVIYQVLFFSSLQYISPTTSALIFSMNPFFIAFGEILILKQRRSGRFYLGFLITAVGGFLVIFARGGTIDLSSIGVGELIALAACLVWSAYSLLAKATKKAEWDSLWISGFMYLMIAVMMIPYAGAENIAAQASSAGWTTWLGMLYVAVLAAAFAHTMYYVSIQRLGAAISATFTYLVPSFAAVFEFVFMKTQFTVAMGVGTVLVVSGLVVGIAKKSNL